ncbi:hypothetical protein AUR64_01950 [Haloprofundus marisrubri]|uniref:DUF1616 domain-containing protein n=1 Tax=Haloprofundus marisrubri TaxID=1514971 RepID=A0A0W1R392_9EURY|nr:DUF1616 domain-containing protein [Haloprofundus marisrubri]KTG07816.1 hypothetical protein AUR64_01950 [Haloprofundus marisrubri]
MKSETKTSTRLSTEQLLPTDIFAALLLAGGGVLAALFVPPSLGLVRLLLGLPLLLFLPGYALVAALFPNRPADRTSSSWSNVREPLVHGITGGERLALSFGLSLVIAPILVLGLGASVWGISLQSVLGAFGLFVTLFSLVGVVRRYRLSVEERYNPSFTVGYTRYRRRLSNGGTAMTAVNVLLVLGVVAAASSMAFALAAPPAGGQFTNFSLLSQDENGTFTSAGFPSDVTQGTAIPMATSIENKEGQQTNYSVVVQLQRMDGQQVVERQELTRFSRTVGDGSTWRHKHSIVPSMTGEDLRVQYLMYEGEPPADPRAQNADDTLHIWITVTEP